jgi:phosphatidylserine/phosphatidylglycerophosphate/cardiolipin synthase-like enzyme
MHNKFCVIDSKKVWTGSYNPNPYAVYENNDAIAVESEELAGIYTQEFEKLWGDKIDNLKGKLNHQIKIDNVMVEVYFSPEDGAIILDKMLKLLKNAKYSIYFAQFTITHSKIAKTLIKKAKEGIDVKGIMEYGQIGPYSKYLWFELMNMDVKKDKNYTFAFHHKFFIIDENIVVSGSLNPTLAGLNKNRENILIIYSPEVAKEYLEYLKGML